MTEFRSAPPMTCEDFDDYVVSPSALGGSIIDSSLPVPENYIEFAGCWLDAVMPIHP